MSTPREIPQEMFITAEDMQLLSTEELLDKAGKLLATGLLVIPGLKESGEQVVRQLETTWPNFPERKR